MESFWSECVKPILIIVATWLLSIFAPVENTMWILLVAFLLNIIVGIVTAVNAKREHFSMQKFFKAFYEFVLYIIMVVFLYWVGKVQKDAHFAEIGVKWVTWIVLYSYGLNIIKNANKLFPKAKAIELMYLLLSTEVFQRLKDYLGIKKNEK
jgi:hypothetical protein